MQRPNSSSQRIYTYRVEHLIHFPLYIANFIWRFLSIHHYLALRTHIYSESYAILRVPQLASP